MKRHLAAMAIALCAFMTGSAHATTVLKVSTADMSKASEWVVRATVLSVKNVDLRAQGRALFTDVELLFSEVYAGKRVPSRYTLRLIGGTGTDGITLKIPGMPTFRTGEDVILFLEKTPTGHIPCGLGQGVYRVLATPSGDQWVRQSMGHVNLLQRGPSGRLQQAAHPWGDQHMPIDSLIERIQEARLPKGPAK